MLVGRAPGFDLANALLDPAAAFGSPEEVLRRSDLPDEWKVEILCLWAYDASELAVAEEEGMGGGEDGDIGAVMRALDAITGGFDSEHVAPTKHGGFVVRTELSVQNPLQPLAP